MTISPALDRHIGDIQSKACHAEAIACAIEAMALGKALDTKIMAGLASALVSLCIEMTEGLDGVNLPKGGEA